MQCWRIKRFIEEEVLVTKILEGSKNNNEKKVNAARSYWSEVHIRKNMQPNGEVGTIVGTLTERYFSPCYWNVSKEGLEVQVSPGEMTQEECKFYWRQSRSNYWKSHQI